jgi:hypothetical protein
MATLGEVALASLVLGKDGGVAGYKCVNLK